VIAGPSFAVVRVIELNCRYSSISEFEGPVAGSEDEAELVDGTSVVGDLGEGSPAALRFFFSFLGVLSSGASSHLFRFFLRSDSSETGAPAKMRSTKPDDHVGKRTGGLCGRFVHLHGFYG
jgi:hypothetical protein